MAYTANTPNANDRINVTQQPIKDNFGGIETAFEENHGDFDGPDEGKHIKVVMPEQTILPTTGVNEGALYTKVSALNVIPKTELYFRRESDGDELNITGGLGDVNDGWYFLPSGLLVKYGKRSGLQGPALVSFAVSATIPVFATIFVVLVTTSYTDPTDIDFGRFVRLKTFLTTGFNVQCTFRTKTGDLTGDARTGLTYWAIGEPVLPTI